MDQFDINTAHVREAIIHHETQVTFPFRYLELYWSDFLTDHHIAWTHDSTTDQVTVPCRDGWLVNSAGDATSIHWEQLYLIQITTFHAQHWYPELPPGITFESALIRLSTDEVQALRQLKRCQDDITVTGNGEYMGTPDIVKTLNSLVQRITQMNPLTGPASAGGSPEVFIRLNSVSPKGPRNRLRVRPGWIPQALDLIITSNRTYDTLGLPMDHYLMIRQWARIEPASEFRCFIYRNRLTAISQYHCYQYFRHLQGRHAEIRDQISRFYEAIFRYLPYEDCVMDVILVKPEDSFERLGVKIVEFNSFGSDGQAGSALYNWIQDESILYATSGPADIRLVTEKNVMSFQWS
jgi:hypothetical protein